MEIGIFELMSPNHDEAEIDKPSERIIKKLKETFEIKILEESSFEDVDLPVIFIKTGGTENQFRKLFPLIEKTLKPVTILTTGENNSLPAAMEILSWLIRRGITNAKLIHGTEEKVKKELAERLDRVRITTFLRNTRIGVIGKPSDWLIASKVNYLAVKDRLGISFIDIRTDILMDAIADVSSSDLAEARESVLNPAFLNNISEKDIDEALKIYSGLKRVISDFSLTALTLRCFDLIKPVNSTGCLALAMLNDEGIIAGCEGDVPALVTMILSSFISKQPSFMANPSIIEEDTIHFGHCTVPVKMVSSFGLDTHFETGKGVAVTGTFSADNFTVAKLGGCSLDTFYADEAVAVDAPYSERMCRTQIKLKMKGGTDYFLKNPLGNHHIISAGLCAGQFRALMRILNVSEVQKSV